jgi:D-serine deaminase-like pyridoxal phosphate-dependent protein
MDKWYKIKNEEEVTSPALLIYPERIEENIRRMIIQAGVAGRLRPHVKTHKMSHIVRLMMKHGINKFKCATIAEAEMVAECGAPDILLAIQPVGPNLDRFFNLKVGYPAIKFSCLADCEDIILKLARESLNKNIETHVWLDINNGMNRTGVIPGDEALRLYKLICTFPFLKAEGLHVYDGHITENDYAARKRICDESYEPVQNIIDSMKGSGFSPIKIIAGGTPTFPIHSTRDEVETSPGTIVLWDYGYSNSFSDLDYLHAAVLLMRIISKPEKNLICIDLGHKAIASEMPQPRLKILNLDKYEIISQNEEHMVLRTFHASDLNIGDIFYGIPYHICPTVDRFDTVTVIVNGIATFQWNIEARNRKITF